MTDLDPNLKVGKPVVFSSLERRLGVAIGLGLLVFSLVAGALSYAYGYFYQLDAQKNSQQQLVRIVQAQAEVAVFAANTHIAREIVEGLLTTPAIRAVRLESNEEFVYEDGRTRHKDFAGATSYPLYSPVNGMEIIGRIQVLPNENEVRSIAGHHALALVMLMLLQVLIATLLIVAVSRRIVSQPVARLAQAVRTLKPGSGDRLPVEEKHEHDEIGFLATSGNNLINAIEAALVEATVARQAAESADGAKSEFLAVMSHEMRTPLGGAIGMLNLALQDPLLSHKTRDQLQQATDNAQSLLKIISDLLDLSKIEAGKLTFEHIDFALHPTLNDALMLQAESAAQKGVCFAIELDPQLPAYLVGDPMRLKQILINLASNAVKFTKEGEIRVIARVKTREGSLGTLEFSVQDTGIGIPPEEMHRLFKKFEQADSSTSRRFGGTGLGLAICRQLVEGMGGTISVESVPGVGTTFRFILPFTEGAVPKAQERSEHVPHSHRLRLLCAEDFMTNQLIIKTLLEKSGHTVDIVDTGVKAVAAAATVDYDAILMDERMPELDGVDATRLIRMGTPKPAVRDRDIYIIALTANASEENRRRSVAAGMNAFMAKPIDEAELHYQLHKVIERQLARGIALPPLERDCSQLVLQTSAPEAEPPTGAWAHHMHAAFRADLLVRWAELEFVYTQRDSKLLGRLLHGLCGNACYLGDQALRECCFELEGAADRGDWLTLDAKWPALIALLSAYKDCHPVA